MFGELLLRSVDNLARRLQTVTVGPWAIATSYKGDNFDGLLAAHHFQKPHQRHRSDSLHALGDEIELGPANRGTQSRG
jgi:hypothetical protein